VTEIFNLVKLVVLSFNENPLFIWNVFILPAPHRHIIARLKANKSL
jgi:hypothetical protein